MLKRKNGENNSFYYNLISLYKNLVSHLLKKQGSYHFIGCFFLINSFESIQRFFEKYSSFFFYSLYKFDDHMYIDH